MSVPNTERSPGIDSSSLEPTDQLEAIEKLSAHSVEFQTDMITLLANETERRAPSKTWNMMNIWHVMDALNARYAEPHIQNEALAVETNKRFTELAVSQAKVDACLAMAIEQHTKHK